MYMYWYIYFSTLNAVVEGRGRDPDGRESDQVLTMKGRAWNGAVLCHSRTWWFKRCGMQDEMTENVWFAGRDGARTPVSWPHDKGTCLQVKGESIWIYLFIYLSIYLSIHIYTYTPCRSKTSPGAGWPWMWSSPFQNGVRFSHFVMQTTPFESSRPGMTRNDVVSGEGRVRNPDGRGSDQVPGQAPRRRAPLLPPPLRRRLGAAPLSGRVDFAQDAIIQTV